MASELSTGRCTVFVVDNNAAPAARRVAGAAVSGYAAGGTTSRIGYKGLRPLIWAAARVPPPTLWRRFGGENTAFGPWPRRFGIGAFFAPIGQK